MSPMLPTVRHGPPAGMRSFDGSACAASSITVSPRVRAMARIASISQGSPAMCTGITARVLGVIFRSRSAGSRFMVSRRQFASTGLALR